MTDKELEKKAEEYQTGRKDLNYFSEPYKDKIRKAYIAGAKELQKEIIEIEKVSDALWEENQQLKRKISVMQSCHFNGCIGCNDKKFEVKK